MPLHYCCYSELYSSSRGDSLTVLLRSGEAGGTVEADEPAAAAATLPPAEDEEEEEEEEEGAKLASFLFLILLAPPCPPISALAFSSE